MATDNSVTLVGNITRDPELRFTPTGQATATFGLAVNRRWQNRQTQEWEEATSFFDVVCWREMAENVERVLTRGSRVIVTGRLEQRTGRPRTATSAPRSRSWPTRSAPACAGPPPRSPRTSGAAPVKRRPRAAAATGGPAAAARRRPAATATTRSLSDGTEQPARGSTHGAPQGPRPPGEEEALRAVPGQGGVGRLQGRPHAAQVHERPGQDPRRAGSPATAPSTSGSWRRPSRRRASWCCCPTPSAPSPSARAGAGAAMVAGTGAIAGDRGDRGERGERRGGEAATAPACRGRSVLLSGVESVEDVEALALEGLQGGGAGAARRPSRRDAGRCRRGRSDA